MKYALKSDGILVGICDAARGSSGEAVEYGHRRENGTFWCIGNATVTRISDLDPFEKWTLSEYKKYETS